jgi:hypothetical protein
MSPFDYRERIHHMICSNSRRKTLQFKQRFRLIANHIYLHVSECEARPLPGLWSTPLSSLSPDGNPVLLVDLLVIEEFGSREGGRHVD